MAGVDAFDVPLGGIQQAGHVNFKKTFVETVVAEFRFGSGDADLPQQAAVEVWSRLGRADYPHLEPAQFQTLSVQVSPGRTEQSTTTQHGWSIANSDRTTSLIVLPSALVITLKQYERFSTSLGDLAREAFEAFVEVLDPVVIQRIGLRYINRLSSPDARDARFWSGSLSPAFSGPLSADMISHKVQVLQQQVGLNLTETASANIHHGVLPPENLAHPFGYLLDIDVFEEQTRALPDPDILNVLRQLNRTALALFSLVLSERYLTTLNPTELSGGDHE